jgi:hypothetical protein
MARDREKRGKEGEKAGGDGGGRAAGDRFLFDRRVQGLGTEGSNLAVRYPCNMRNNPAMRLRNMKPAGIHTERANDLGHAKELHHLLLRHELRQTRVSKESLCDACNYERSRDDAKWHCTRSDKQSIGRGVRIAHRELIADDAFALNSVDDVWGDLIALEPLHLCIHGSETHA